MKKILLVFLFNFSVLAQDYQTVEFPSLDGLMVTADLYKSENVTDPTITVFHQSGSSRGEYRSIAPKLVNAGFNVLAVDLRWGGTLKKSSVVNETAKRNGTYKILASLESGDQTAKSKIWPTIFASYQDMLAAQDWLSVNQYTGKRIVLGSSFSSILVFKLAKDRDIDAVLSFSPAEYFPDDSNLVKNWLKGYTTRTYITGGSEEVEMIEGVYHSINTTNKTLFKSKAGRHGAAILVEKDNFLALLDFLKVYKKPQEVSFLTNDNIKVFADLYTINEAEDAPFILMFHQGASNARAEYLPLVDRLLDKNYNILMVDQRRGGERLGGFNRTVQGLASTNPKIEYSYCDVYPDIEASIEYLVKKQYSGKKLLWGSSYSSALVMRAAVEHPDKVDGVLAFSPSSGTPLKECAPESYLDELKQPFIAFRPPVEMQYGSVFKQFNVFKAKNKQYIVVNNGIHGSSMLNVNRVKASVEENWQYVLNFIEESLQR